MGVTRPPLEYLATCSQVALESFELSRLNQASNLRKELQEILDGWMESEVDARLARWILDCKQFQVDNPDVRRAAMAKPLPFGSLDLSFLPLNGRRAALGEEQENAGNSVSSPLQQPAAEAPPANERDSQDGWNSSARKSLNTSGKSAAARCSDRSASTTGPRKPAFAQEEDNALRELEDFAQRLPAAENPRVQNMGAGNGLQITHEAPDLPGRSVGVSATTAGRPGVLTLPSIIGYRSYALRAFSISALELTAPLISVGRPCQLRAQLSIHAVAPCGRPAPVRSRRKTARPCTIFETRTLPAS
jgi:hypothetical protein